MLFYKKIFIMCSRINISHFWILSISGFYLELSELDDEESLRRRAGERDLRRGEDLGDPRGRLPAGDRDLLPPLGGVLDLILLGGDLDLLLGAGLLLVRG